MSRSPTTQPRSVDVAATVPPPHSIEAEQAVLGAILVNNLAYDGGLTPTGAVATGIKGTLRSEHFAESLHARIYELIESIRRDGTVASIQTIRPFLEEIDLGKDDRGRVVTSSQYLARLAAEATTIINVPDYAAMIVSLSRRRAVIATCAEIEKDAATSDPDRDVEAMVADGMRKLQTVAMEGSLKNTRKVLGASVSELLVDARAIANGEKQVESVPTGFHDVDRMIGGYEPGALWVIGARPGMGKTALMVSATNALAKASVKREQRGLEGWGSVEFSLEVPERQNTSRHLAEFCYRPRAPITFGSIMRGDLDEEALWLLDDAAKRIDLAPVVVDYSSRLSIAEIAARVRMEKLRFQKQGVKLAAVWIDYLKFIKASDRYRGQRVYEVGEISASLKQLAKDEDLTVVLLCQLNRALESREDKRPGLSDLRESGDLEADADVVGFLHRESYYIEKSPEYRGNDTDALARHSELLHVAEFIIAKNRAGPCRTVPLYCDIASSHFASESKRDDNLSF